MNAIFNAVFFYIDFFMHNPLQIPKISEKYMYWLQFSALYKVPAINAPNRAAVQHTLGNLFLGYSTKTVNTTLYQVISTINNGIRKDLNGRVAHSTHLVYCKSRIDLFIILILQHRQPKLSGLYVSGLVIQSSPKFIGGAAE